MLSREEKNKRKMAAYYRNHEENKKKANDKYYENHAVIREQQRVRYLKSGHKRFREAYTSVEGTAKILHNLAMTNSKRKSIEFDLTVDWFIEHIKPMVCEATGVALSFDIDESKNFNPFRPSTDRIDNSRGYTKDNCRIVCVMFNFAKGEHTDADVFRMSKAMVLKYGSMHL